MENQPLSPLIIEAVAMVVELIPVLEIGYNNQGIQAPDKYPYWQNPTLWDAYHAECYAKAGFRDELFPYLSGASFYRLTEISAGNLAKLATDHTAELRAGSWAREATCGLFGGYVLRIDGEDVFFPQCCGDLSDIGYWQRLAVGTAFSYEGHPAPSLSFTRDTVVLDFVGGEFDEPFQPPLPVLRVEINQISLQKAVEQANLALNYFAQRLIELNTAEGLGIPAIDKLLIWGDGRNG